MLHAAVEIDRSIARGRTMRAACEGQVGRIASMVGSSDPSLTRVEDPVDLTTAKRNRFLSPLGE